MSSQKIKLVLVKSYVDSPTFNDTFSKNIEVDLPEGWEQAHILTARSYQQQNAAMTIGGDITIAPLTYKDENDLMGKILTLADMSFSDQTQREAFKSVARQTLTSFTSSIHRNALKTVDANERREQECTTDTVKK